MRIETCLYLAFPQAVQQFRCEQPLLPELPEFSHGQVAGSPIRRCLLDTAANRGNKAVPLTHRGELLAKHFKTPSAAGSQCGIVQTEHHPPGALADPHSQLASGAELFGQLPGQRIQVLAGESSGSVPVRSGFSTSWSFPIRGLRSSWRKHQPSCHDMPAPGAGKKARSAIAVLTQHQKISQGPFCPGWVWFTSDQEFSEKPPAPFKPLISCAVQPGPACHGQVGQERAQREWSAAEPKQAAGAHFTESFNKLPAQEGFIRETFQESEDLWKKCQQGEWDLGRFPRGRGVCVMSQRL